MNLRGPVLTLLAVAVLAGALFLVNIMRTAQPASQATASPGATAVPTRTQTPAGASDAPGPGESGPGESGTGAAATAPAETAPENLQQTAYAGRTSGNEATIAIAVENGQAVAYVCDGRQTEAWLQGTVVDGTITLQGNDARADGVIQGDAVFGTVWLQDKQWPYAAQLADPPAGLYQGQGSVNGAPARIGWILLQDGSQVGVAEIGGTRGPAPALDRTRPDAVQIDGVTIVPRAVNGADQILQPPS